MIMRRKTFQPRLPRRRGATAVLAMLYLVLFSTMAVGFYAATTMSAQVSANDERITRSFAATESGMDFIRFHLARVNLPSDPLTPDPTYELWHDIDARMKNTGNFTGLSIGRNGNVISIPAEANGWVKLDTAGTSVFRATITDWPAQGKCVTVVYGKSGNTISRAISMDYSRIPRDASVFDNAIASKGQILVQGGAVIAADPGQNAIANMMSALDPATHPGSAITMTSGTIGGKLTILDGATAIVTGGSVNGETNVAAINDPANGNITTANDPPAFPIVDTTPYAALATNIYTDAASAKVQKNVRIPRNSGTLADPYTITGSKTLQGIVYIETPNVIDIQGSVDLQGFIVFEKSAAATPTDRLLFTGNIKPAPVPSTPEFAALRTASGVSILAPTADVVFDGNGGTQNKNDVGTSFKGNMIVNTFEMGGSVDLIIDNGSIITLKEGPASANFHGKTVKFLSTGGNNLPAAGVVYGRAFRPEPGSYEELKP
jgi:hypothetical protein